MSIRDALKIPAADITDEWIYQQRRQFVSALALTPAILATGCSKAEPPGAVNLAAISPSLLNSGFVTDETRTLERDATTYNNFYEFGTNKGDPAKFAHRMTTSPWTITVSGECENPGTIDMDDIARMFRDQERVYRMRCVEGWSMVIPWLGIPLGDLLKTFKPTSKAKYVAFETLADRNAMVGMRYPSIKWPYREGLRIDEAMHPLTILANGMYGKKLPNQNGAPLRLIVPWKYGFKGIKSIVAIRFTEKAPTSSWNQLQPSEYGFFSNVNPNVDHPRWSQKSERRISGSEGKLFADRIPTKMFNGYADQVAALYQGMDLRKWF